MGKNAVVHLRMEIIGRPGIRFIDLGKKVNGRSVKGADDEVGRGGQ